MPPQLTVSVADPSPDSLTVTFYGGSSGTTGPDFTLVEIPDTQYYSASMNGGTPSIFAAQTQWIAANRTIRNIAYVAHVGDIVQNCDNNGNPVEWIAAEPCMRTLEDPVATLLPEGIPYGISPGSHDIAGTGALVFYNQYFGVSRFQGRSYYGGHFGADNGSWYEFFSASGLDFIVIGLKLYWTPVAAQVHWADSLLTAYPNRRAVVVSHYLLDPGPPATFSPQGQAIYDGLKSHTNLILMICGHYVNEARRADTYNGHTIYTVMANYQNLAYGGSGWLRYMEFSPAHNQIRMRTYSPWLDRYEVSPDSSGQFTIPCDLSGGVGGFQPIGTFRGVAPGSKVAIPWTGLQRGQSCEWYATVSDGSTTVTGPTWQFETVENIPPVVAVTAPNGGEALTMGQRATITWNATDASGVASVDVLLSRNGGSGPWQALASAIPNAGSFNWWVTGPPTTQALVRVVARDVFGNAAAAVSNAAFQIFSTTAVSAGPPGPLALEPVAPNPSSGRSRLGVVLPESGRVRLGVLDVTGREVVVLVDAMQPAGRLEFDWDGHSMPPGLYIARLEAAGHVLTRRFTIAR
jgi:hypothetical protein